MPFVALRPFTDSNRPPSYQASASEPESNWHFLVEHSGIEPLIWLGFNHDLSFTGLMPLDWSRLSGMSPQPAAAGLHFHVLGRWFA